jgi:protein SCO1/2
VLALLGAAAVGAPAHAQAAPAPLAPVQQANPPTDDEVTRLVQMHQKLDASVPKDLRFKDETGRDVRLGDYFGDRPVVMILIQFRCTMLCNQEMNLLVDTLQRMSFLPGREFTLLTVSIDPREKPDFAAEFKKSYLRAYGRQQAAAGWHFLTGEEPEIARLADAVGYRYVYVQRTDQFAHPDGLIVVTPEGRISRYFLQLDYPPRDLRLSLVEAASNRIGSPLDALALLCFHYDPVTGRYGLALMKILRLSAVGTVLLLALGILLMGFRGRAGKARAGAVNLVSEG